MPRPLTAADLPERFARFAEAEVAAGHFPSVEDVVEAGLTMLQESRELHANDATPNAAAAAPPASPSRPPFWASFTSQVHALPDEVFAHLPEDGASEHDHYLYGAPKSRG